MARDDRHRGDAGDTARHPAVFAGVLQVDSYAAYRGLADPRRTNRPSTLTLCWSHARRKFQELAVAVEHRWNLATDTSFRAHCCVVDLDQEDLCASSLEGPGGAIRKDQTMLHYDNDWTICVLEDLANFFLANSMPLSHDSMTSAIATVQAEQQAMIERSVTAINARRQASGCTTV